MTDIQTDRHIEHGKLTSLPLPSLKKESMLKKLMLTENIKNFKKINNTITNGIQIVTCN
jgi:hypothetical protein